jgi:hypothetical protein
MMEKKLLERNQNNRTLLWIVGVAALVLCCLCLMCLGIAGLAWGLFVTPTSFEGPELPFDATIEAVAPATAAPRATPRATTPAGGSSAVATPSADQFPTEVQLESAVVPARDLRLLGEGLRGTGPIPEVVHEEAPTYSLNERQDFWIHDDDSGEHFQIRAHLAYQNDLLYMWVEDGVSYDPADLKASADKFAEETYPVNRNFFGSEWNPGVDSDPRLHILHSERLGSRIAGYF